MAFGLMGALGSLLTAVLLWASKEASPIYLATFIIPLAINILLVVAPLERKATYYLPALVLNVS